MILSSLKSVISNATSEMVRPDFSASWAILADKSYPISGTNAVTIDNPLCTDFGPSSEASRPLIHFSEKLIAEFEIRSTLSSILYADTGSITFSSKFPVCADNSTAEQFP